MSFILHSLRQILGGIPVSPKPATIEAGTVGASAQAAPIGEGVAVNVFIQNPAENAVPLFVGDDAAQPVAVPPGGTVTLPTGSLSSIFVRADEDQPVAFIAQRS